MTKVCLNCNELVPEGTCTCTEPNLVDLEWDYNEAMSQYDNAQRRACEAEAQRDQLRQALKEERENSWALCSALREILDALVVEYNSANTCDWPGILMDAGDQACEALGDDHPCQP